MHVCLCICSAALFVGVLLISLTSYAYFASRLTSQVMSLRQEFMGELRCLHRSCSVAPLDSVYFPCCCICNALPLSIHARTPHHGHPHNTLTHTQTLTRMYPPPPTHKHTLSNTRRYAVPGICLGGSLGRGRGGRRGGRTF